MFQRGYTKDAIGFFSPENLSRSHDLLSRVHDIICIEMHQAFHILVITLMRIFAYS